MIWSRNYRGRSRGNCLSWQGERETPNGRKSSRRVRRVEVPRCRLLAVARLVIRRSYRRSKYRY
jgi:hypothetical protein